MARRNDGVLSLGSAMILVITIFAFHILKVMLAFFLVYGAPALIVYGFERSD